MESCRIRSQSFYEGCLRLGSRNAGRSDCLYSALARHGLLAREAILDPS